MAKDHGPSVKDDERYEALRRDGASKEKAARIAAVLEGGYNLETLPGLVGAALVGFRG